MRSAALQAPLPARVQNCSLGPLQAQLLQHHNCYLPNFVSFSRILPQLGSKFPVTPVFILPF